MKKTLIALLFLVASPGTTHASGGTVKVFYAGSLLSLNENLVGPAFSKGTGYAYQGKGAGSLAIANQIKGKIAIPDVVELADPTVDAALMGNVNGNYVSWYFTFARTSLVIGFDPKSRFAKEFRQVQHHQLVWYKALLQKGLRIGRTDPDLDPKGYRAIWMANLAQRLYHLKNFKGRIFGSDSNPSQVFPEDVLVARMLTGQVNAGIFYLSEVRDLGIPYVSLPGRVNLGDARYSKLYSSQHFKTSQGVVVKGSPIEYTITIPTTVKNEGGAEAFLRFVLSSRVRAISAAHGLLASRVKVGGDRGAVPPSLSHFIGK